MEIKKINLNKNSIEILGQKLLRGCQIVNPFYSHVVEGYVGNIRTALTYLSRENVDKKLVSKPRLNKQELNVLISLPKKKIADYDGLVKTLLSERIRNDEIIIQELKSLYCKEKKYFAVMFVAEDENGRPFIKRETSSRDVKRTTETVVKEKVVKNFKKDLPYTQKRLERN